MLNSLMQERDEDYTCKKTGTALGKLISDETGSLLEEIIIRRRIELWGEIGRIYDIRRLKQGFRRTADMGWPCLLYTSIVIGINVSFINCSINKIFQMLHMLGYCICLISRFIKKFFKIRNEIIG